MKKFIFYDFEVYKEDWLVEININGSDQWISIRNDAEKLRETWELYKEDIWVGYNSKFYDKWILFAIIHNVNPYIVSKGIVEDKQMGWTFIKGFNKMNGLDVKDELPPSLSLKEIEANLGMNIVETSVDFNINRKLTKDELDSVAKYCKHDVKATIEVFKARSKWIEAKLGILKEFALDVAELSKTSAGLAARVLGAKRVSRNKIFKYEIPSTLRIEKYKQAIDFYTENELNAEKAQKMQMKIANIDHIVSTGGLHGALEKVFFNSGENGDLIIIDADSYYPYIMIIYKLLSRSVPQSEVYEELVELRFKRKRAGDPSEQNLKVLIAAVYGAQQQKGNGLYDPTNRMKVCVTGQLFLIDLIEKIENVSTLIQSNTDGIIVQVLPENKEKLMELCKEWEDRTSFRLGYDELDWIWQKDVNNYITKFTDSKKGIKTKGAFVKHWEGGDFSKNSSSIIDKAVVGFFSEFKLPEETINNPNNDAIAYQIVTKSGGTYYKNTLEINGETIDIQKVNRIFASINPIHGKIYKYKKLKDGSDSKQNLASIPERCQLVNENIQDLKISDIKDVDMDYYINMAWARIKQYIKPSVFKLLMENIK